MRVVNKKILPKTQNLKRQSIRHMIRCVWLYAHNNIFNIYCIFSAGFKKGKGDEMVLYALTQNLFEGPRVDIL